MDFKERKKEIERLEKAHEELAREYEEWTATTKKEMSQMEKESHEFWKKSSEDTLELLNKELQTEKLYKVLIGVGITLIIVVIITLLVDFWDTYLWFL